MNTEEDISKRIEKLNTEEKTSNSNIDDNYILSTSSSQQSDQENADNEVKPTTESVRLQNMKLNVKDRVTPTRDVAEKIIICIDACSEENSIALSAIQNAVEIFIRSKYQINNKHEYAVVTLEESKAKWVCGLTNYIRNLNQFLTGIQAINTKGKTFDISSLFELIQNTVTIPPFSEQLAFAPPYVVRVVLIYNRSKCTPVVTTVDPRELLSPYFFLDIVWLHELKSEDNNVSEIQALFHSINDDYSYHFEIEQNATILQNTMAMLLGHPLQRPALPLAKYTLALTPTQDEPPSGELL